MRTLALLFLLPTLVVLPARAQIQVAARTTAYVPEVMQMEVLAHDGTREAGAAPGAAQLRIRANRTWKVVVSSAVEDEASLWVRVSASEGAVYDVERDFVRVSGDRTELVRGGPGGDTMLTLDYRWAARDPSPRTTGPVYTLVPD
jgi:hypothetical protein